MLNECVQLNKPDLHLFKKLALHAIPLAMSYLHIQDTQTLQILLKAAATSPYRLPSNCRFLSAHLRLSAPRSSSNQSIGLYTAQQVAKHTLRVLTK